MSSSATTDSAPGPRGRRILFLTPFPPRLDGRHGGGRLTAQLLLRLAHRHRVALLCVREPGEPPVDAELRARCALVEEFSRRGERGALSGRLLKRARTALALLRLRPPWVRHCALGRLARRVGELDGRWRPDLVQLEFHVMAQYVSALQRPGVPRILTQHEPGASAAGDRWSEATGVARLRAGLELIGWERYERAVLGRMDAIVTFTERDRRAVRARAGTTLVRRIRPGIELPSRRLDPVGTEPHTIVFFGAFRHPPNVDAAFRLVREVLPAVRQRCPEARMYLLGEDPPPELVGAAGDGVIVPGFVPSLEPYLERAAVVVAPLFQGGGIRVKVLEALASGKALVASPLAVEGLPLSTGVEVEIGSDEEAIANRIADLLEDPARRRSLASRAAAWAEANLSWEAAVLAYERLYDELLEGRARSEESAGKANVRASRPDGRGRGR